jgi:hypothetical protein
MSVIDVKRDTSITSTRLKRPWLIRLMRYGWVTLFVANFLIIAVNYVIVTPILLKPCEGVNCEAAQHQFQMLDRFTEMGVPKLVTIYYRPVLDFASWVIYMVLSLMIFRRSPPNDWMSMLVSAALFLVGPRLSGGHLTMSQLVPSTRFIGFGIVSLMFTVSLTALYLYPTGRLVPRWSWVVLVLHILSSVTATFIQAIHGVFAPYGLALFNGGLTVVGVGFQVYRYRYFATPIQRQQSKLVIAAVLMMVFGQMLRETVLRFGLNVPGGMVVLVMMGGNISAYVLGLALPIAITSAVLRYRLWDADLVINRSVVYAAVTGVMALTFLIVLFAVDVALRMVIQIEDSTWSLIAATVVVVAAYNPLRRAVSRTLDLYIYGFRIDLDGLKRNMQYDKTVRLSLAEREGGTYTGSLAGELYLENLLGRGGMGEVYLGRHRQTGQVFAVKMLPRELGDMSEALERFERESRMLTTLKHPNIIRTHGAGFSNGTPYYVMDFIDGRTLSERLKRDGILPLGETLDLLAGIAIGLDMAHAASIIHRDVKPSNVLLRHTDGYDEPVLTDFGIAKLTDEATPAITRSTMMGTLEYVAPEQILVARDVDHRADIYSLGIVAYQMLTGAPPFTGSAGRLVFAHLNQPVPDPCDSLPDFPRPLSQALLKALAKNPEDRYASASEFVSALRG